MAVLGGVDDTCFCAIIVDSKNSLDEKKTDRKVSQPNEVCHGDPRGPLLPNKSPPHPTKQRWKASEQNVPSDTGDLRN